MKHYFWLLCAIFLLLPLQSQAASSSNILILNQNQDQVMIVGPELKESFSFTAGPCPSAIEAIPGSDGYLLMCKGSKNSLTGKKAPGTLIYLDSQLKPTTHKITLPGMVIKDFFLKESATWVLITDSPSKSQAVVCLFDLKSGNDTRFNLDAVPTAYQFNFQRNILAVTTLGDTGNKISPQLVLIDLHELMSKSFPVSTNPGGIYFINDNQVLVACGGFRNSFNYSSATPVERFEKPVNASLHWIDTNTGNEQVTTLGYSPVVILQDSTDPKTFYTACCDTVYDKIVKGTFRKLTAAEVKSTVSFSGDSAGIIQTKSGKICLLGRNSFYLIDPVDMKILANLNYNLEIDKVLFNSAETIGYIFVNNSNTMDEIDIATGNLIKKVKISSSIFAGIGLSSFFPTKLPPVIGSLPADDKIDYTSSNNRVLMTSDGSRLYVLASRSEVGGIELESGNKITSTKFLEGKPYGIHFTPNAKFVAVAADTAWYLLDPGQKKPVLSIPLYTNDNTGNAKYKNNYGNGITGYYSPDGNLLVIPSSGYFYFVDCQSGKLVGKIRTRIENAVVTWQP